MTMAEQETSPLPALKAFFPEDSLSWIIPALRRESTIWSALHKPDLLAAVQDRLGDRPSRWTPTRIALTVLEHQTAADLPWPLTSFQTLPPEISQQVHQSYQASQEDELAEYRLADCTRLALGLWGEVQSGKTWQNILSEMPVENRWQPVWTIVFGLVDSQEAFLACLSPDTAVHLLFTIPEDPSSKQQTLIDTINRLDAGKQLSWLQVLADENPALTAALAAELLKGQSAQPVQLDEKILAAELNQAAGNTRQALALFQQASNQNAFLQKSLSANLNRVIAAVSTPEKSQKSWRDLLEIVQDRDQLARHGKEIASVVFSLLENEHPQAAEQLLAALQDPLPDQPELLTAMAAFALEKGQQTRAGELALLALEKTPRTAPPPRAISPLLLELGMNEECLQASQQLLEKAPNHGPTVAVYAEALCRSGDPLAAARQIEVAALMKPDRLDLQRKLAGYLEEAEDYQEAIAVRSRILSKLQKTSQAKSSSEPFLPADDLQAFARCAYAGGQYQRAAAAARQILHSQPDHGPAHSALGKSLLKLNQEEEAYQHLEKAVVAAPEREENWIALADALFSSGDPQKAVKTLQLGINAANSSAKIFHLRGKIHQAEGALAKALDAFRQSADRLEEESVPQKTAARILCDLGRAYYQLGHLDRARSTLHSLQLRYPASQEGQLTYGQVLLDLDEPRGALPYLARVVESNPRTADPYVHYADAHLRIGLNPEAAARALQQALEIEPDNQKALALIGEAQVKAGELEKALKSFQTALETSLSQHPFWGPRITLGLGKTALALGKTETALATLKDGYEKAPQHPQLIRGLAEAYRRADLNSNAVELIHKAALAAPEDEEILRWIADFGLQVNAPEESVTALKKLIKRNPDQHEFYLQLGQAQAAAGSSQKAVASFNTLSKQVEVTPNLLYQAGDALINLGELDSGLNSLYKAAHICEENPDPDGLLPGIYARLSSAYEMNGDSQQALSLLDKAIEADLDQPSWRVQKSDLLIKLEKYQAATASLKNALDLRPQDPELHYKMAEVLSRVGSYSQALYHAQESLSGYLAEGRDQDPNFYRASALTADLAAGKLDHPQAWDALAALPDPAPALKDDPDADVLHGLCLKAELSLENNQEIEAAELGNLLVSAAPQHPRVLALQARILARQGTPQEAQQTLQKAIALRKENKHLYHRFPAGTEAALGTTARELQHYEEALTHFQHATRSAPHEQRALINLIRTLIIRAEVYRLASCLRVIHHAPAARAISADAWSLLESSLQALKESDFDPGQITQFEKRGRAVLTPNLESAQALGTSASDLEEKAAVIAAYRHCRQMNLAAEFALDELDRLGEYALLDAQISLAVLKIKPEEAVRSARSALKTAQRQQSSCTPYYYILLAMAEHQAGNRQAASSAAAAALEIWPDEPRWYALAAEIALHPEETAQHLEKAIQLEPAFAGHHYAMGKALLENGTPDQAVSALEQAVTLNEDLLDAWLALAESYRRLNKTGQALECTARVLDLAEDHLPARKAAARICHQQGNYREAEQHLITLLGQDPQDTEAMSLLASTLAAQKQPEQGLSIVEKALQISENKLDLELQRASLIKEIEGPHAAVDALRLIGSRYPDQYPLILALVKTLADAGESDQAIRTAQEILHNGELSHTPDQKADLHLITGRLLRAAGQLDQAVHHLHQAKKVDRAAFEAALELGRVHQDRRQYDQALNQIQQAIKLSPQTAEAYYQAGRVLKELKQYDRAERMLRRAAKLAPNDLKIHRQLGVLVTLNLVHGEAKVEAAA